ncbi:MAG: HmuY family protein [Bacteroidia bacterium]|nr:HmuY family protein [Bacteroidia bacterium]
MKKLSYILLFVLLQASSCFTNEEPILPLEPEEIDLRMFKLDSGQVYVNLKDISVMKFNSVEAWDIAFSCAPGRYDILLNSARGMSSYNTESKDFNAQYTVREYPWEYDKCTGAEDQSCLGAWGDFEFDNPQSYGNVYLINLGIDINGEPTGIVKMKVNGYTDNKYSITVGDLDGFAVRHYEVEKNDSFNYVYLSFEKNGVLKLEPPKNEWDLLFTPYAVPANDGGVSPLPIIQQLPNGYELVDGVLLNPYKRQVAIDTNAHFEDIDFFDVESYTYSDSTNAIGHTWYTWYEEYLTFRPSANSSFIIRDADRNFYALKFTSYSPIQTKLSRVKCIFKNL